MSVGVERAKTLPARTVPTDQARSVPAASFAAFAESGLLYVPVRLLIHDSIHPHGGPLDVYLLFVLVFTAAVALATALRRFRSVPTAVAAGGVVLGLAQARLWALSSAAETGLVVILTLLLALRVITLAIRDWRDPIRESFGIGCVVLLVDIAIGGGAQSGVREVLPAVVAQFFLGALASRAASVRLTAPKEERGEPAGPRSRLGRLKPSLVGLAMVGLLLGLAAALGGRHGALHALGRAALLAGGWIVIGIALLLARVLVNPAAWLVLKLHINLKWLQRAAHNLGAFSSKSPHYPGRHGSAWDALLRLAGLGLIVLLVWVLVRMIRRYRELMEWGTAQAQPEPAATQTSLSTSAHFRMKSPRRRRELPADTVRRWYAEALLLLERRGLAKPDSRTPGEHLQDVARTFPESASGFTALTRAYEDVRYGYRTIDASSLDTLEIHRNMVMGALAKARKVERAVPEAKEDDRS